MVENSPKTGFLKSILRGLTREPQDVLISSGVQGIDWKVADYNIVDTVALGSHKDNINKLAEQGVTPLTFGEIENALGQTSDKWVLFDSTIGGVLSSNHWRVVGKDNEKREITLRFCGPFGNHDMRGVEPFTISMDTPFFTGATVHKYQHKETGESASLQQIVDSLKKYDFKTEYPYKHNETIYWVDEVPMDEKQKEFFKFIPHSVKV